MSELEIKGGILEMVTSIKDKETLSELKDLITNFLGNHKESSDYWEELSDIEKNVLDQAIKESEDETNHVNHDEVMQKYNKWLDK